MGWVAKEAHTKIQDKSTLQKIIAVLQPPGWEPTKRAARANVGQKKKKKKINKIKMWRKGAGQTPNTSLQVFLQVASVSKPLVSFTAERVSVHSPLGFTDGLRSRWDRERGFVKMRTAEQPGWIQLQLQDEQVKQQQRLQPLKCQLTA